MTTKNPFTGMNPFMEQRWRDAHTMLIAYLRDALQERLPEDLIAGAEEEVVTIGTGDSTQAFRPDLQVRETLPQYVSGSTAVMSKSTATHATEPIHVFMDDEIERRIEIHDETGRLITVIELLSPSNKLEAGERDRYASKRRSFINAGVNLIEIDLVRRGTSVFPDNIKEALRRSNACYGVCVFRAEKPTDREIYPIHLRDRLPTLSIPLRPSDMDVVLELQPLIDQCHERGRYHRLNYRDVLDPPLPPEEAAWVDSLLRDQGLRGTDNS